MTHPRKFSFSSRALYVHGYFDRPFWHFVIQVGWRHWQWWEIVFSHKGTKTAHLDLRQNPLDGTRLWDNS